MSAPTRYPDDQLRAEVIRASERGESWYHLAKRLGVDRGRVYKIRTELGFAKTYRGRNISRQRITIPALPTELAYIAGIIDGEGCIHHREERRCVDLTVDMTDEKTIAWLAEKTGTTYRHHLRSEEDGWHTFNPNLYIWKIAGRLDVLALLNAIEPYMITKRDQALAAIQWLRDTIPPYLMEAAG